ncbi:sulfotransferase [Limnospira fusiformis SAG 85.79]|uniref:Sulfotransferase n=3 Tax=Sirenicapillariaceae TaxID=2934961 RepID=B5W3C4_LIMMA|nr:sulfotransferase [Limnospira maxima CS-328]EKD06266.1 sulfotransferase [Arthrospira platensis C1]QJB29556.1 sulfotransferase [Limnospira fusiformis SAG 85.79]UWU48963.1 Sulfotransferase family protein [Arthrospira platensis C1]
MTMPNFLIIGAAKSGTSSLEYYLKQHPQIYMSYAEEMHFFAFENQKLNFQGIGDISLMRRAVTSLDDYQAQFQDVSEEIAIGEKSAWYLYHPKVPERIKHYIPNVKLITVLRNPVDRAYSSFLHLIRDYSEPIHDLEVALEAEPQRIDNNWEYLWHYQQAGFDYQQLQRYFDIFAPEQIGIFIYEDYRKNPEKFLVTIFDFLCVDKTFKPDLSKKINVGKLKAKVPKNQTFHNFGSEPNIIKSMVKNFLPISLRERIREGLKQTNLGQPPLQPQVRKKTLRYLSVRYYEFRKVDFQRLVSMVRTINRPINCLIDSI